MFAPPALMASRPLPRDGATAKTRSFVLPSPTTSRRRWPKSWRGYNRGMCRNIKTLANFEPPATDDEIRASALQFVRKLSGASRPSKANEQVFNQAVDEVTAVAQRLIRSLTTTAPPRNREIEAQKAQERARQRYA